MSDARAQHAAQSYRVTFGKHGVARFTGHLDVQRAFERAFRRAGLALLCSGGYHPRPRMQFAAALPLGLASRAELVDVWLVDDPGSAAALHAALGAVAPPGIEILAVQQAPQGAASLPALLRAAEYEVCIAGREPGIAARVHALLDAGPLPRRRRDRAYDLRPLVDRLTLDDGALLRMRLAAGARGTGRPEEVLDALGVQIPLPRVERVALVLAAEPGAPRS